MRLPSIVIDTNVLVAGLRFRTGASFRLLSEIGNGRFHMNLSVPLVLEYEDVLLRPSSGVALPAQAIADFLDYICAVGARHEIFFLWRPFLKDPRDDMVLELAVKSESERIVTFNKKDFVGSEKFGVRAVAPVEFLRSIGVLP